MISERRNCKISKNMGERGGETRRCLRRERAKKKKRATPPSNRRVLKTFLSLSIWVPPPGDALTRSVHASTLCRAPSADTNRERTTNNERERERNNQNDSKSQSKISSKTKIYIFASKHNENKFRSSSLRNRFKTHHTI